MIEVVLARSSESKTMITFAGLTRKVWYRNGCRSRIARIAPSDYLQYECNIGGAAGYWPYMIIERHEWHRSVTTYASKTRF